MTVAARAPSIDYRENGVTLAFAVPFRFLPGSLTVSRLVAGIETPLATGVDFAASDGASDAGGTVTLTATVPGAMLRIRRVTPRTQAMNYTPGDRFPAESHEQALDRGALIDQEQDVLAAELAARALCVPLGERTTPIPTATARAGRLLGFDAEGAPIAVSFAALDMQALRDEVQRWYLALLAIGDVLTPVTQPLAGLTILLGEADQSALGLATWSGTYTKLAGKRAFEIDASASFKSGDGGALRITGLPFTAAGTGPQPLTLWADGLPENAVASLVEDVIQFTRGAPIAANPWITDADVADTWSVRVMGDVLAVDK